MEHSSGESGGQQISRTGCDLSVDEIRSTLKSSFLHEIICCNSVGSTNDVGMALPLDKDLGNACVVIVADSQEKGRGRFERTWISPPRLNIYCSIVMQPLIPPADAPFLTILAALASAAALTPVLATKTGAAVSIKWPNDLMVGGKKLGGILTEARTFQGAITRAVIGIGINLNSSADNFPPEIAGKATSVLLETGSFYSRSRIIAMIVNEFEPRYKKLLNIGGFPLVQELKTLLVSLGREVVITDGALKISGFAEDIADDGSLILRLASGIRKKISSGEIILKKGD